MSQRSRASCNASNTFGKTEGHSTNRRKPGRKFSGVQFALSKHLTAQLAEGITGLVLPTLHSTSYTSGTWREVSSSLSGSADSRARPKTQPSQPAAPASRCWSSLWHPDGQPTSVSGSRQQWLPGTLNAEELVVTHLPKTALTQHTVLAESVFGHWLPVRERKPQ